MQTAQALSGVIYLVDWVSDDFEFLAASAKRTIALHRSAIGSDRAWADRRGRALRGRIARDLEHYEQGVERSRRKLAFAFDDEERDTLVNGLRATNQALARLAAVITWMRVGRDSEVSPAPVLFAEEAGRNILARACEVTAVTDADPEYATRVPTAPWVVPLSRGSPEPLVVFLPPHERGSALLYPLLVHEIAHTALPRCGLVTRAKDRLGDRWASAIEEAAGFLGAYEGQGREIAVANAGLRLHYWLRELLCDAIALSYCGPSYLYAFAAAALQRELGGIGESHPPAADRIASMIAFTRKLGWGDVHENNASPMSTWLVQASNARLSGLKDYDERLLREMIPLSQGVHELVSAEFESVVLRPAGMSQLIEVAELMDLGVLPAQLATGGAADRRTILYAAWQQVLRNGSKWNGDAPSAMAVALADQKYQDFVERAIELSFVVDAWGERRGTVI